MDARTALLTAAFALWATLVLGSVFGFVRLGLPGIGLKVLILGVPPVSVLAASFVRTRSPAAALLAGASMAVVASIFVTEFVVFFPAAVIAVPAVVIAAVATHRFPTASLVAMFVMVSAYGSIDAFTHVPPGQVVDLILAGLWLGLLGRLVLKRHYRRVRMTPGFLLLLAFLVITLAFVPFGLTTSYGLKSFRLCGWHLSVLLLVGYGGFRARTLERLLAAMVVIVFLVSCYAALRWAIGHPAGPERDLVNDPVQQQYNLISGSGERKVQGSFPDGQELGVWMACAIPFLVGILVGTRGKLRLIALVGLPVALIGMFGSNQRAAAAAAVAGISVIVVVHLLSRGFRGPRLGVALAAVTLAFTSAVVIYPAVINDPVKRQRYDNLLRPGQDESIQGRLHKWRQVIADLRGQPFGFGLGTGDTAALPQPYIRLGADEIDNSYLKIAYEQGMLMMGLFVIALLVVLIELLRHALWSRAPGGAGLATAAAGTLVAIMAEFMAGISVDRLAIVTGWVIVGLGIATYAGEAARERQPEVQAQPSLAP